MKNELDKQKLHKWYSIPYTGHFLSLSRAYVVSSSHLLTLQGQKDRISFG